MHTCIEISWFNLKMGNQVKQHQMECNMQDMIHPWLSATQVHTLLLRLWKHNIFAEFRLSTHGKTLLGVTENSS